MATMTAVLNLVKPEATFDITARKASIENVIDYSTSMGIKLCQKDTQSLTIKLNVTRGELNQFIESLKDLDEKMVYNPHVTS